MPTHNAPVVMHLFIYSISQHLPPSTQIIMKSLKVIIIGAGAAGIAAASRLLENDVNDLIVLEAKNRIGGRINSVNFGGSIVDLGAQWCHGEEDNVVYNAVKDLDLLGSSINSSYDDFIFYESSGKVIEKSITDEILATAYSIGFDDEVLKNTDGSFGQYFISKYNDQIKEKFGNNAENMKIAREASDWFHKLIICLDAAPTWFDLSAKGVTHYCQCEGDKYLHWRNKGYKTILDVLMKKYPHLDNCLPIDDKLYFNKEVHKIIWNQNALNGVTVQCLDGSSYNADNVIITLPLGVLKVKYKDLFSPELPVKKQNAINGLSFGTVNKVLLKFPFQWWRDDPKGFSFIWTEEDRNNILNEFSNGPVKDGESWLEDVSGFYPIDSHPNILLAWIVGSHTFAVEQLADDIIVDGCMYLLRKFLGHKYDIPQPDDILCSAWKSDPHICGSYSYRSVKSEECNVFARDLEEPVYVNGNPVVLFAGEATHSHYYSTVHGAIETGFREADRIINTNKIFRTQNCKIAIIGAGMAGLGAAHTLIEGGCEDIIILEAQDEAGGRIKSVLVGDQFIDVGAQWIHGTGSFLHNLAKKHNLLSAVASGEGLGIYVRDDGYIFDDYMVNEVDFEVGRILELCEQFVDSSSYPQSVGEFLEEKFMEYLKSNNDATDIYERKLELFDWHLRFQVIDNACSSLRQLSAREWGKYVCNGNNGQAHINLENGYKSLIDILTTSLPSGILKYNLPASKICWKRKSNNNVQITCQNGYIINCDHVVVTASIGVLKDSVFPLFEPPLPIHLNEAIDCMGYGNIGKIYLVFDQKWWNTDGFQLIWRRNIILTGRNSWTRYISGFDLVFNQPNLLLGWVGGDGVAIMETLSEEEIGLHCMQLLKSFLKMNEIPYPSKVIRTKWTSCQWTRGGYSHTTPQCDVTGKGSSTLSEPVLHEGIPRILLAGEACHPNQFSTTHGAFESGQKQAQFLLRFLE